MTLLHAFQVVLFVGPAFGLLCIPARTARGSLFQLFCLPVPVLMTLCSCGWCWGTPDYDTTLGYGMAIVWVSMLGVLYVYLPLWVLHLGLFYVDKCRSK